MECLVKKLIKDGMKVIICDSQDLGAAIQKFGWTNFSHEILFDNLTKEKAERLENITIGLFRSNDERFGYNANSGGSGGSSRSKQPVRCIKTGIIYESMSEASRQTGTWKGSISNCCHGKRKLLAAQLGNSLIK